MCPSGRINATETSQARAKKIILRENNPNHFGEIMKCIRRGDLRSVLITAGMVVAFLGMAKEGRTAPVSSSATAMPTAENAYCGKGDVWTGAAEDGPARLPEGCVYT